VVFLMKRQRTYSRYAKEAAVLLGEQIRLCRKQKRWTENELAERAGISRATLQKIEKGDMSCAVGLVFEVATLVNIPLFEQDTYPLSRQVEHIRDKVALLPQRIRTRQREVGEDF
jgi:transcriptional regulator with XRE-family HTH domain